MTKIGTAIIFLSLMFPFFIGHVSATEKHKGIIIHYHLNSAVNNRGACIRMSPTIPNGGAGWACLYKDNSLYQEITSALLACKVSSSICEVEWNGTNESGHKIIQTINLLNK